MPHLILDILLLYNCSFMLLKIIIHLFIHGFLYSLFVFIFYGSFMLLQFHFVWASCYIAYLSLHFFFKSPFPFLSFFNRVSYKVCFFKRLWLCKDKTKVRLVSLKEGDIHNSHTKRQPRDSNFQAASLNTSSLEVAFEF